MAAMMKVVLLALLTATVLMPKISESADDVSPSPTPQAAATVTLAIRQVSIGNSHFIPRGPSIALRCTAESSAFLVEQFSRIWWSRHDDDNDDEADVESNGVVLSDDDDNDGSTTRRQHSKNGTAETIANSFRITTDLAKRTSLLQILGTEEFTKGRYSCFMAFGKKTFNTSCLVHSGRALCSKKPVSSHSAQEQSPYTTQPQPIYSLENQLTTPDSREHKQGSKTSSDDQPVTSMQPVGLFLMGSTEETQPEDKDEKDLHRRMMAGIAILAGFLVGLMVIAGVIRCVQRRAWVREECAHSQEQRRMMAEVWERLSADLDSLPPQTLQEPETMLDIIRRRHSGDTYVSVVSRSDTGHSYSDEGVHTVRDLMTDINHSFHPTIPRMDAVGRTYSLFYTGFINGQRTTVWRQMPVSRDVAPSIDIPVFTTSELTASSCEPFSGLPSYSEVLAESQRAQNSGIAAPLQQARHDHTEEGEEPPALSESVQSTLSGRHLSTAQSDEPPSYESQASQSEMRPAVSFTDLPGIIRPPSYHSNDGDEIREVDESQEGEVIPDQEGDNRLDCVQEEGSLHRMLRWLIGTPPPAYDSV